ncbi:MAG: hypothetical protein MRERV_41c006 [Mycoplasmataceae bacterium RV_VA103A]|nr:MAG: hypothetical protein MRERV_41c006 [Mycoplasmataceae bacterium RV_VA103A]
MRGKISLIENLINLLFLIMTPNWTFKEKKNLGKRFYKNFLKKDKCGK